jgi:hypothetical protein
MLRYFEFRNIWAWKCMKYEIHTELTQRLATEMKLNLYKFHAGEGI